MSRYRLVIGNKNYSSWSLRAWLAARHAGLEFEELSLDLTAADFKARILALNPAGQVPALLVDGTVIADSLAIGEFLAERNPALWPVAPLIRAEARSLCAEMHAGFFALRQAMPMNARAVGRQAPGSEALSRDIRRIQAIWRTCRARYGDAGPWLFGRYSLVDAMYAPVVLRFRTYGVGEAGAVDGYMATVLADPHLQAWLTAAAAETAVMAASEVGLS